jgi:hypothetical protein
MPDDNRAEAMRVTIYMLTLILTWIASMAELVLGLHGFLFGGAGSGLSGWLVFAGAWAAGFSTVALAEEAALGINADQR